MRALSSNLIFIRWHRMPTPVSEDAFIQTLEQFVERAAGPIYFVSDLEKGHISNVRALRRMADLTKHRNWGGGVSYGRNIATGVYVQTFKRMAAPNLENNMAASAAEALAFLENLKPGLTAGIDPGQL